MTDTCVLRPARATDLPTIYSGELDYIRRIEPEQESRWKDSMRAHLRQWTQDLERMVIAEAGDAALGYCFWEIHDGAAVLASIYVAPEQRGRGIGRQLLERFAADARAQGLARLALGVKPDNPARRLYERAGFRFTHDAGGYRHYARAADAAA
jgi:[ribosomal protein S18]-alanine N-acetyltransferase